MPVPLSAKQPESVCKLSSEEIANPQLVFEELFDFAHLPEARSMLWDWLKATVTGTYPEDLSKEERNNILFLYEKMEKLIEAAYLLKEKPAPKKKAH